jgi:hypothetical protein
MGISAKWLRSLVGLRKVERQQRHHKEDVDVGVGPGRMVRAGFLPIIMQFLHILFLNSWLVHSFYLLPRPMWIMQESFFL